MSDFSAFLLPIVGTPCSIVRISSDKSLTLGFGKLVPRTKGTKLREYYEWELGSYLRSWRAQQEGRSVCGGEDEVEYIQGFVSDLNASKKLGTLLRAEMSAQLDVSLFFSTGYELVFFAISTTDECFHVFAPSDQYLEVSSKNGLRIGRSDQPWV